MQFEATLTQNHPAPVVVDPADLFQPNSSWRAFAQGVRVGPDGRANVGHGAIQFRVTERQGDHFRATYTFEGRGRTIEVEGDLGKTTRTRQGTWRDINFFATRNITGTGPIGPATTHKGLIRDRTFEVVLPPFRSGREPDGDEGRFRASSHRALIARPEQADLLRGRTLTLEACEAGGFDPPWQALAVAPILQSAREGLGYVRSLSRGLASLATSDGPAP